MWTKHDNLHQLLIEFARVLIYFDDVELTHGGDEDQVCLHRMKLSKIYGKPKIFVNNSRHQFVWDICLYIYDATNLIFVTYFSLYSNWKKNSFGFGHTQNFCSSSLLKKIQKNAETQIAQLPRQLKGWQMKYI